MAPCLICYFILVLSYIEKKWLLIRNLATIQNCMKNFSVLILWMEVSNCWKMVEFPKSSVKIKNCKTFYEGQTGNHVKEIIQPLHHPSPQSDKSYYSSGTKSFLRKYTEIYKHLLSRCFKNTVLGRPEMMQYKSFFWHQTEKCWLENLKSEKGFWLCCKA